MTVVVIGAGPAGLASAAMLQRAGERVIVLERGDDVGSSWRTRYDRLHLHTVRWLSCLPGYRIPRAFGKWVARDRVIEYLQRYASHHALDVRTGVEVESLQPGWTLETSAGPFEAARVVVATGHSNVPFLPAWPGEFAGDVVHSADYRNPEPYRGRRVVVVGAGNSAAEIAVDVQEGGAREVLLSVRTPPNIVRRDTLGFPSQILGIVLSKLPVPVVDRVAVLLRRATIPDLTAFGLPAPEHPYLEFLSRRMVAILDVGIVAAVRDGRVRIVAPIEGFDGDSVVLADGSRIPTDAVIAATGFRTGLEPLVGHLGVLNNSGEPLVHGVEEHPAAPRLHFVGYRIELDSTFRVAGIDARRLARGVRRARTQFPAATPAAA